VDARLYRAVNGFAGRTTWAHGPATAFAKGGVIVFVLLLLVAFWQARRLDDPAAVAAVAWAALGTLAALGAAQVIGHAVARARPYDPIPGMHVLVARTQDFSFPSDHATMAGAVAAGVWLVSRRLGIVAAVLALLMAVTRVYVGAHYPGDVLAGAALGAAVVLSGWFLVRGPATASTAAVRRSRLRPLLVSSR